MLPDRYALCMTPKPNKRRFHLVRRPFGTCCHIDLCFNRTFVSVCTRSMSAFQGSAPRIVVYSSGSRLALTTGIFGHMDKHLRMLIPPIYKAAVSVNTVVSVPSPHPPSPPTPPFSPPLFTLRQGGGRDSMVCEEQRAEEVK